MRIIIILFIIVFANVMFAQDKLPEPLGRGFKDTNKEWVEKLSASTSNERLEAIIECNKRDLYTKVLIERLWKDWKYLLPEILLTVWPPSADLLIDRLYESKDEYMFSWAHALFQNRKFSRIDLNSPVAAEVRSLFYDDYKSRASLSYSFGAKYEFISKKPWLYKMFIDDTDNSWSDEYDKHLAHFFAGKNDLIPIESWVSELIAASSSIECPNLSKIWVHDAEFGEINAAVLICLILDRPDWARILNDKCKLWPVEVTVLENVNGKQTNVRKIINRDHSNKVVEIITMLDINKAMTMIENYRDNNIFNDFNKFILLHHPCCDRIRNAKNFKEWLKSIDHRIIISDPDPSFEHARYGYE